MDLAMFIDHNYCLPIDVSNVPWTLTVVVPFTEAVTMKQILDGLPKSFKVRPMSTQWRLDVVPHMFCVEFWQPRVASLYSTLQTFSTSSLWFINVQLMPNSFFEENVADRLTNLLRVSIQSVVWKWVLEDVVCLHYKPIFMGSWEKLTPVLATVTLMYEELENSAGMLNRWLQILSSKVEAGILYDR